MTVTRQQRNRRSVDESIPPRRFPATISSIAATAADTIQITFGTSVLPAKLPLFKAGAAGDETVASMTRINDTVVEFVFTGDVQGTNMTVQEGDPGIRTVTGGFVPAGTYAVPAFP